MKLLSKFDQIFTRWLTRPEPNAAGRLSLFRIVYGLFYLWIASPISRYEVWYGGFTPLNWSPILPIRWLNPTPPDVALLQTLAAILIFSLVLLTFGFLTRWATLSVLVTGIILVGIQYSIAGKIDHSNTFLVAYIPAIMLFSRWNALYSVDALFSQHPVKASDDSWVYIWPVRAVLLLLALMFFGSAYLKITGGQWLTDSQLFINVLLVHNVVAVTRSAPPNPLNLFIAGLPVVPQVLQFSGLLFELAFPLALINHRFRYFFVATAVVFHSFNHYFLAVSATPLLIVYLVFVDWQALYDRLKALVPRVRVPLPALLMVALAVGVGVVSIMLWRDTNPLASIFRGRYIWAAAAAFGAIFMVKYAVAIIRDDILTRLRPPAESVRQST